MTNRRPWFKFWMTRRVERKEFTSRAAANEEDAEDSELKTEGARIIGRSIAKGVS